MNQAADKLELTIAIDTGESGLDELETDAAARNLDRELAELLYLDDIKRVKVPADSLVQGPGRAKSGEAITIAALAMAILPVAVPNLIDFLRQWTLRPNNPPLKIRAKGKHGELEIEFNPATTSAEQVKRLAAELKHLTDSD
jgi:hypothetical protein